MTQITSTSKKSDLISFAEAQGVKIPEKAKKSEILAALRAAGHLPEAPERQEKPAPPHTPAAYRAAGAALQATFRADSLATVAEAENDERKPLAKARAAAALQAAEGTALRAVAQVAAADGLEPDAASAAAEAASKAILSAFDGRGGLGAFRR